MELTTQISNLEKFCKANKGKWVEDLDFLACQTENLRLAFRSDGTGWLIIKSTGVETRLKPYSITSREPPGMSDEVLEINSKGLHCEFAALQGNELSGFCNERSRRELGPGEEPDPTGLTGEQEAEMAAEESMFHESTAY